MSEITIDSEVLQKLLKQVTTKETKKRKKVHINYTETEKQDFITC